MTKHILPQESVFYDSSDVKLRNTVLIASVILLLINLVFNLMPIPKEDRTKARELPPRLTKLVMERKQVEQKKEELKKQEEIKKEVEKKEDKTKLEKKDEKKPEEKKPEEVKQKQEIVNKPEQQAATDVPAKPQRSVTELRERASKAGILAMQDELADLRDESLFSGVKGTGPLTVGSAITASGGTGVGGGARGPSAISSAATRGSGGINTAGLSRSVGTTQQLATRTTTQMTSPVKGMDIAKHADDKTKGPRARSREEIDIVVDANKGSLMAIYQRALRENPALQGKVVFEITIEPEGTVTASSIKSSDLGDPELEKKLATRIKMFKFGSKDVERMTVTIPIQFTPSMG